MSSQPWSWFIPLVLIMIILLVFVYLCYCKWPVKRYHSYDDPRVLLHNPDAVEVIANPAAIEDDDMHFSIPADAENTDRCSTTTDASVDDFDIGMGTDITTLHSTRVAKDYNPFDEIDEQPITSNGRVLSEMDQSKEPLLL